MVTLMISMDLDALKDAKKFSFMNSKIQQTIFTSTMSMGYKVYGFRHHKH